MKNLHRFLNRDRLCPGFFLSPKLSNRILVSHESAGCAVGIASQTGTALIDGEPESYACWQPHPGKQKNPKILF
ncbi:MAG: hypothetical protein HY231_20815 [Acidobacteria bacterium]|nr:hypothetical protein [Acidobacteriota bacterium]